MIKQKLMNKRVERNLSQEKMADLLGMVQSQYNRRENGVTKISKNEWEKMAKVLETTLEEIYEPEDGVYIISGNAYGSIGGDYNTFNNFSEIALETMQKYIQKLEEENQSLKEEIKALK